MSKREREKGAIWERDLASRLREVWPEARRGLGQARSAGEVSDVDQTAFWVEAKHRKKCTIQGAYRQGKAATDGRPVIVCTKDDRQEPLVTMSLEQFLQLAAAWTREQRALSPWTEKK